MSVSRPTVSVVCMCVRVYSVRSPASLARSVCPSLQTPKYVEARCCLLDFSTDYGGNGEIVHFKAKFLDFG